MVGPSNDIYHIINGIPAERDEAETHPVHHDLAELRRIIIVQGDLFQEWGQDMKFALKSHDSLCERKTKNKELRFKLIKFIKLL